MSPSVSYFSASQNGPFTSFIHKHWHLNDERKIKGKEKKDILQTCKFKPSLCTTTGPMRIQYYPNGFFYFTFLYDYYEVL